MEKWTLYSLILALLSTVLFVGCKSIDVDVSSPSIPSVAVTTHMVGGVVPHHDAIATEIDRFWSTLTASFTPELIVLVGPDHQDEGKATITTTPVLPSHYVSLPIEGTLDTVLIERLSQEGVALQDERVFADEHSILLELPFIHQYAPDARVVPLLFRSDAKLSEVLSAVERIRSLVNGQVAVVASVDFSHYLSRWEAEKKDQATLAAIQTFNYDQLSSYGSEHLDSDQSLIFMSELVCPQHTCAWEMLFHGNSSDMPSFSPTATTSYFSFFLYP